MISYIKMTNNLDKYKYICDNDNKMYYKYNNIILSKNP